MVRSPAISQSQYSISLPRTMRGGRHTAAAVWRAALYNSLQLSLIGVQGSHLTVNIPIFFHLILTPFDIIGKVL